MWLKCVYITDLLFGQLFLFVAHLTPLKSSIRPIAVLLWHCHIESNWLYPNQLQIWSHQLWPKFQKYLSIWCTFELPKHTYLIITNLETSYKVTNLWTDVEYFVLFVNGQCWMKHQNDPSLTEFCIFFKSFSQNAHFTYAIQENQQVSSFVWWVLFVDHLKNEYFNFR